MAERAREFTPDKPEVRDFIGFLKQHHTVLDPTMSAFEGLFLLSHCRSCFLLTRVLVF